jgi:sulfate adenylyltransferase subunit 2
MQGMIPFGYGVGRATLVWECDATMDQLDALESESIYIIREAYKRLGRLALLWSFGKDSNVLIWLAKKAFVGHLPLTVLNIDTGNKMPEMYSFRDRYAEEWNVRLIVADCPPIEEINPTLPPAARVAARKTAGLKRAVKQHGFEGLIVGIRRDEEGTRGKERVFSPRGEGGSWDFLDQPPEFWGFYNTEFRAGTHIRVHPLLHWTELDIWRYIRREGIPVVNLYFARDGRRYRSLGDKDITFPVVSDAATLDDIIVEIEQSSIAERSGRACDRETEGAFENLRSDGYL